MWHITLNIIDDAHWTLRVCMCVCAKHFLKVKCIFKNSFKWPTWVLCCGSEPRSYWRKKPQACVDGPWLSRVWLIASSEALCIFSGLCPHPGSQRNSIQNPQLKVMSCNCLSLHDSAAQHLCRPSWPLPHPTPPPVFPSLLPEEQLVSTLENGEMPLQKNHHPLTGFSWASNLRTLNKTR